MKTITSEALDSLCQNGKAIDIKSGYPAVVLHPDGTVTKIWARKKSLLSSSRLRPYSNRFIKNAHGLAKKGIVVPEILNHAKVKNSHVRLVTYQSIPGKSIRELLESSPEEVDVVSLCQYINDLQDNGILFRAIHLGNIIQLDSDHHYGLIDFTDLQFYEKPISLSKRAMNIAVPLHYREDINKIEQAGLPNFLTTYMGILKLEPEEKRKFKALVETQRDS